MSSMGWWCLVFLLLVIACKAEKKPSKAKVSPGRRIRRDGQEYATTDEIDEIMCRLDEIEERLG